jgi:hypothetical protein
VVRCSARLQSTSRRQGKQQPVGTAGPPCHSRTPRPAGWVGRASLFRLTRPELGELLTAAEAVLAATGSAVALCPVWGTADSAGPGARPAGQDRKVSDE